MSEINPYAPTQSLAAEPPTCHSTVYTLQQMTTEFREMLLCSIIGTFTYDTFLSQSRDAVNRLIDGYGSYPDIGSVRHATMIITTAILVPVSCYAVSRLGADNSEDRAASAEEV